MFTKAIISCAALIFASSAIAGPGADAWAVQLKLEPGRYTVHELAQIAQVTGHDRKVRIMLIDKAHAAFQQRVFDALGNNGLKVSFQGQ